MAPNKRLIAVISADRSCPAMQCNRVTSRRTQVRTQRKFLERRQPDLWGRFTENIPDIVYRLIQIQSVGLRDFYHNDHENIQERKTAKKLVGWRICHKCFSFQLLAPLVAFIANPTQILRKVPRDTRKSNEQFAISVLCVPHDGKPSGESGSGQNRQKRTQ